MMIVDMSFRISGEDEISEDIDSSQVEPGLLIEQARNEQAAFVQLYRCNYDGIFRYCAHRLFSRELAEDMTSVVFLKAIENFRNFTGTEAQFRNWLYKIATNAVNDHIRRAARRERSLRLFGKKLTTEVSGPQEQDCLTEQTALLKQAIFKLKPRYQTIITLRFFENMKLTEIAEVLGSSPGTVRSQLGRALAVLRKHIAFDMQGVFENE
jgi:RNA polymerase sigma-70 factor (ECF subfamily)